MSALQRIPAITIGLGAELEWWWRVIESMDVWTYIQRLSGGSPKLSLPGGSVKGEFVDCLGELEVDPSDSTEGLMANLRQILHGMADASLRPIWADKRPECLAYPRVSEMARYEVLISVLSQVAGLDTERVRAILLESGPGANAALHLHADVDPLRVEWAAKALGILNAWGPTLANLISALWGEGRTKRNRFWSEPPFRPEDGPRWEWTQTGSCRDIALLLGGYPALISLDSSGEVTLDLISTSDTAGKRSSLYADARPTLANRLEWRSCGIPAGEGNLSLEGVEGTAKIFLLILSACEAGVEEEYIPRISREDWEKSR